MKKLTKQELDKVIILQSQWMEEHPKWRTGQALYNALYELYPEVGDHIKGTHYDPYYCCESIDKCLEFIGESEMSDEMKNFISELNTLCFKYGCEIKPTIKGLTEDGNYHTITIKRNEEEKLFVYIDGDEV